MRETENLRKERKGKRGSSEILLNMEENNEKLHNDYLYTRETDCRFQVHGGESKALLHWAATYQVLEAETVYLRRPKYRVQNVGSETAVSKSFEV